MTTRADLIETAAKALYERSKGGPAGDLAAALAEAVLDAVLPQITTAEQLEAYGGEALVLTRDGQVLLVGDLRGWDDIDLLSVGPLTVVWQPEQETRPDA